MKFLPFEEIQIPVSLKRQNRKSVRFKYEGTTCFISAPYYLSDEKLESYCFEKKKWLIKTFQAQKTLEVFNQKNMILGQDVQIRYHSAKSLDYKLEGSVLNIYKANRLSEESAYLKVKDKMAFDIILAILAEESKRMNVVIHSINLRVLKASWGRCNSKKDITLSTKLIECPIEFIRYVCIHECAHILEMNHSKNFWAIVEQYCPNYKQIRKLSAYTL